MQLLRNIWSGTSYWRETFQMRSMRKIVCINITFEISHTKLFQRESIQMLWMFKIIFERVLRLCTFHRPLCRPLRRPFCRPIHVICSNRPSSTDGCHKNNLFDSELNLFDSELNLFASKFFPCLYLKKTTGKSNRFYIDSR